jgi:hypothetical protein
VRSRSSAASSASGPAWRIALDDQRAVGDHARKAQILLREQNRELAAQRRLPRSRMARYRCCGWIMKDRRGKRVKSPPRRRNPVARALRDALYRARREANGRRYARKPKHKRQPEANHE